MPGNVHLGVTGRAEGAENHATGGAHGVAGGGYCGWGQRMCACPGLARRAFSLMPHLQDGAIGCEALGNPKWLVEVNNWEIDRTFSITLLVSANLCFHLHYLATTQVEAEVCAVEEDTFEVYLYVTIKNEKVSEGIVALKYFIII